MVQPESDKINFKFLIFFALFWVFLGWLGFVLAFIGFLEFWIFIIYFTIGILSFTYFWRKSHFKISKEFLNLSVILLVIVVIISFFVTPTIFSGRDQGAISEAAIRLAQNGRLEFSTPASDEFFKVYGPGRALNFPGFHYTQEGSLITQFPLVYISWLAIFYSLFNIYGLIIANAILLFLFFLFFYILSRIYLEKIYSFILLAVTVTLFPFIWFSKFTLSENLALPLLWISILGLILFIKKPEALTYIFYLSSALLLVFTRIEGILFLAVGIIVIYLSETRNYVKGNIPKRLIIPVVIFIGFFLAIFFKDPYFYKEVARAIILPSINGDNELNKNFFTVFLHNLKVFYIYGIIPLTVLAIIGIVKFFKEKQWLILVPFFIVLPSLWYIISPHVSPDHPWMLRRFTFSIFPLFIFYSILFVCYWRKENARRGKALVATIVLILIVSNIYPFLNYSFRSENIGLARETYELSKNFSSNDLVLIDREASGDGWSMISGPMNFLFNENAVYFFNPDDLAKINRDKFSKVFLIVSDDNVSFYEDSSMGNNLIDYKDYSISTSRLEKKTKDDNSFLPPKFEKIEVTGKIFEIK